MESEGGSQGPQDEELHPLEERALRPRGKSFSLEQLKTSLRFSTDDPGSSVNLTAEEIDAVGDGEPYCFRCGKPASSFHEYRVMAADGFGNEDAAGYVREEEGTYNPDTNRFACDACYIAIGMPTAPRGWRAP